MVCIGIVIARVTPFLIRFASAEQRQQRAGPRHAFSCRAPSLPACFVDVVGCAVHLQEAQSNL